MLTLPGTIMSEQIEKLRAEMLDGSKLNVPSGGKSRKVRKSKKARKTRK
jgi:hypothetical protein